MGKINLKKKQLLWSSVYVEFQNILFTYSFIQIISIFIKKTHRIYNGNFKMTNRKENKFYWYTRNIEVAPFINEKKNSKSH